MMDWYRYNVKDFTSGTVAMTTEEVGAYQLLLNAQWDAKNGRLPLDDRKLAGISRLSTRRFRSIWKQTLSDKFEKDDLGYFNVRLDQERQRAMKIRAKRQAAAEERWAGRNGDASALQEDDQTGVQNGMQTRGTRDLPSLNSNSGYEESEVDAAGRVIGLLNEKTGRSFPLRSPKGGITANAREVVSRLRDGWTEDELRAVVVRRWRRWKDDPKMSDYLQPSTLFRKSNFERYVAEVGR